MKIGLWWTGKTFQDFTRKGCDEYLKRLERFTSIGVMEFPEIKGQFTPEQLKKLEADKILAKIKTDDVVVLLDERGKQYTSTAFADQIRHYENRSVKQLIFLIGGAYGFDQRLYDRANGLLSLSDMTFSHQLIRLIFLEQLYRGYTILQGLPYHHE